MEAGLRTYDKYLPFPEEMNRNLTAKIAQLHFAPTAGNKENLAKENITQQVYVTGNTVIDAFHTTIKKNYVFQNETLKNMDLRKAKCVVVTAHRRKILENRLRAYAGLSDVWRVNTRIWYLSIRCI